MQIKDIQLLSMHTHKQIAQNKMYETKWSKNGTSVVSINVKNGNQGILEKLKNRYRGILNAINGFEISVFSDTLS